MKPHSQAVREAQAWQRIEAAVGKAAGLDVTHRDPGLQQLFRMEALADYLEGAQPPTVSEDKAATLEVKPAAKPAKEGGKL